MLRASPGQMRDEINQLPLGMLEGDDGAGVVAHNVDHGIQCMFLGDDLPMGLGELAFASDAVASLHQPQQTDQSRRAELGDDLKQISIHDSNQPARFRAPAGDGRRST